MSKTVTLSIVAATSLFANIYSGTYQTMYLSSAVNGSSGFANTQRFSIGTNPETGEDLYNVAYAAERRLNPNAYYLYDLYHTYDNNFRVFLPNYAWGFGYVFTSYRSVGLYNVIVSMGEPSTSTVNAVNANQDANLAEDYTPENPEWYADSRSMFEILDDGQNIHYYNRSMLFLEGTYLPKDISENLNKWIYVATTSNADGDDVQYVGMNIYVHLHSDLVDNYVNTYNPDYDEAYCNRTDIYSGSTEEIAKLKNACIYITSFGDDGNDYDWSTHSNIYKYMSGFGSETSSSSSSTLPDGCFKYFVTPSYSPILCTYEEPVDGKYCENNESGSYCETDDFDAYISLNSVATSSSGASTSENSDSSVSSSLASASSSSVYVDPDVQAIRDILVTKQYTGYEIKGEYRSIGSGQFDWVYTDLSTSTEFKLGGCSTDGGFSIQWSQRTRGVLPGPNQTQTSGDVTTPVIVPNQMSSYSTSSISSYSTSSTGYYIGDADGLYIQIGTSSSDWVYVDTATNNTYKLDGCTASGAIQWMTISEGEDSFKTSVIGDRIYFSE